MADLRRTEYELSQSLRQLHVTESLLFLNKVLAVSRKELSDPETEFYFRKFGQDTPDFVIHLISILSVGTGLSRYSMVPPEKKAGLGWWGPRIVEVIFQSQSQGISCLSEYFLGERSQLIFHLYPKCGQILSTSIFA